MKLNIILFILLYITSFCHAQDSIWHRPKHDDFITFPGAQLGYSYGGCSRLDIGANHYWCTRTYSRFDNYVDMTHTFGPSASAIVLFSPQKTLVGFNAAFNYHFAWPYSPRINMAYENYFNGDQRIGADAGVSIVGVFAYAGYYQPIGKMETQDISRWRVGVRLVLNFALVNTAIQE